ncbi:MAG: T7SS effector LXG polymorphic toxin, partial [Eubacteriaceae bacterium]|nr:T7SS effector LXG polymorphic toxin [Eubacteriaceae bacterium]
MGNKIEKSSAKRMLRDMNDVLNEEIRNTRAAKAAIEEFAGDESLRGKGLVSAKRYFSEVYGEIYFQINEVCALIKARNKRVISAIDGNITADRDKINEDEIQEQIERLEEQKSAYQKSIASLKNNMTPQAKGTVNTMTGSIDSMDDMIKKLEDIIKGLYDFNGETSGYYDAELSAISRVAACIDKLDKSSRFNEKDCTFTVPKIG